MSPTPTLQYIEARPPAGTPERGTLLCLHAFPLNARMWEPQLSLAADGWRIVAPHFPGVQDDQDAEGAFDVVAAGVVDLCTRLGVEAPVVCGVSMGGYLSFALLRRARGLVRALVLCDTRAEADPPQAREGRLAMLATLRAKGVAAVADEMIPRLLGETTRQRRPALVEHVRSLALSNRVDGVAGILTAMMTRQDSVALLPTITCPTLIVVGREDVLTPPAMSEAMHQAIAGSALEVLDETGHLPNLEQPERFNATLSRFLASVP